MSTNRSGFTLVELMVVVAIIGILATLGAIAYGHVRDEADDTVIKTDIQSLITSSLAFVNTNNRFPIGHGELLDFNFTVEKRDSYAQTPDTQTNLTACYSVDGDTMAFASMSASGRAYSAYSKDNFKLIEIPTSQWHSNSSHDRCQAISPELSPLGESGNYQNYNGYNADDQTSGPWRLWVSGG